MRPSKDSFYTYVFSGVRRFDALILCEGRSDAEVIKEVIRKLSIEESKSLAITDCEGISKLYVVAAATVLLVRISRKIKAIAVIVDADQLSIKERLESLTHSLEAKGLKVSGIQELGNQVFKVTLHGAKVPIYVAINAVQEYRWFRKHELEDHALKLLELEGKVSEEDLVNTTTAKDYLIRKGYDAVMAVKTSSRESIAKALNHVVTLLNYVMNDP